MEKAGLTLVDGSIAWSCSRFPILRTVLWNEKDCSTEQNGKGKRRSSYFVFMQAAAECGFVGEDMSAAIQKYDINSISEFLIVV